MGTVSGLPPSPIFPSEAGAKRPRATPSQLSGAPPERAADVRRLARLFRVGRLSGSRDATLVPTPGWSLTSSVRDRFLPRWGGSRRSLWLHQPQYAIEAALQMEARPSFSSKTRNGEVDNAQPRIHHAGSIGLTTPRCDGRLEGALASWSARFPSGAVQLWAPIGSRCDVVLRHTSIDLRPR